MTSLTPKKALLYESLFSPESWLHLRSLDQRALCNSNIPGIPDPGNSQDFPGIPGNTVLQFPYRKSGMEFFTLIPVPENGNGIFIPVPVPENWIGIFHLDSRSRKWEWNLPFPVPVPEVQK